MNSSDENFSGISIEEALRLLEESKKKQRLLEKRIRELQSQPMTEGLSILKLHADEGPSSDIGPFSISHHVASETMVIRGIDSDDCENFLQDYLGQGAQRSNRRETQPKSKLIINGRTVPINLSLPDRLDVNTKVTYDVERQELRFEIIKGKAKKDRVQPFKTYLTDQLSHFVNSNYDIGTSFKPQLYAQGKIVEFEMEEEFSGSLTHSATAPLSVVSAAEPPITEAVGAASNRKRAGSGSTDSEPQKGSVVGTNFFVKTMVNPKTAGLSFAVSTLRPDTYLGRQQGAHITAYIVFVTAILETVDEQDITDIPDLLVAAAMQFVPSSQWEPFQDALHELIKENPFFEKKERKRLTADLRETVQETTVQFIKKSVKIHYAVVLAHFIDDLSNQILMAINQSESTLYARAGRPKTRQELGKEGAKVRNAMKELRKISAELSAESTTSLIEQFSVFSVADSGEVTENVDEARVATLRARIRSRAPSASEASVELPDKVATHIFELFDFDYYEYTSSAILSKIESFILEEIRDLEKQLPKSKKDRGQRLTVDQIEITNKIKTCKDILEILHEIEELETSEERWRELMSISTDEEHPLNTLIDRIEPRLISSQIDKITKDIRGRAPEIVAQHIDVVMNYAFSGMKNLPKKIWDAVCEKIIDLVEHNSHWSQMPDVMEKIHILRPKHPDDIKEAKSDGVGIDEDFDIGTRRPPGSGY